ncbi:MAG: SDR family oxidoreductase [Thermoleophilaceae bacterium]
MRADEASGRAALVTGAAGGIGGAVAAALKTAGSTVTAHDRRQPTVAVDHVLVGDLHDGDPRDVVRAAEAAMGRVDVLVHCAGESDQTGFLELTDEQWDAVVKLNLSAAFPLCQQAARGMAERGDGAIVLIGSLCGRQAERGFAHYCAAKAGLEMLGRSIAVELGGRGVRCTTIVPGTIDTPLNDAVARDDQALSRMLARTPVGRIGSADEVADVAVWLAGAPAYVNGASIVVDGGYSIEATP